MRARHLRLVPADPGDAEPTPADRIRMAARRLGMIGREMASHAEELRALTATYSRVARPAMERGHHGGAASTCRCKDLPALRASG